jgi:hypothetical protein
MQSRRDFYEDTRVVPGIGGSHLVVRVQRQAVGPDHTERLRLLPSHEGGDELPGTGGQRWTESPVRR